MILSDKEFEVRRNLVVAKSKSEFHRDEAVRQKDYDRLIATIDQLKAEIALRTKDAKHFRREHKMLKQEIEILKGELKRAEFGK